jgi:hypothetical protein
LPEHGYVCLDGIPLAREEVPLAPVLQADARELKVLEEFIMLKERHISRHMNVEKCLEAIEEASLISYLRMFPSKDKSNDLRAPFWPIGGENSISPGALEIKPNLENSEPIQASSAALNSPNSAILNVLQSLSAVMVTSYFGPRSQMPRGHRIRGTWRQGIRQSRQQFCILLYLAVSREYNVEYQNNIERGQRARTS